MKVKSGNILVAQAFMDDVHFGRAVLMITEHNNEGSIGFVINKPIGPSMPELMPTFPAFDGRVYYGGPVANDTVHYMHNVPLILKDCYHVKDDLYWGGDFNKVKEAVAEGLITKENIRFYVGYSGWSPGQLDGELKSGSWVVSDIEAKAIFEENNEKLWEEVMYKMGDHFEVISKIDNKNKWN